MQLGESNLDGMFPRQKLSMRKKTKQWREKCVDILVGKGDSQQFGYGYGGLKKEMKINYDLYNSIYDLTDLKYVTNPFNVDEGFPATPQNINVIRAKINLLLGEETKRPLNMRVIRTSDNASGEYQDKYKQMLIDYMMAEVMSKLSPEDQERFQQGLQSGEIMTPEHIQKYMSKSYKDIAESTAYHILEYLKHKLNLNHQFMKTWLDALVAGVEVLYVGVYNNDPYVERVNPLYFTYDLSPDLEFIEDGDWCCRKMMLSYTEVYDRLYDRMEENQLDELLVLISGKPGNHGIQKKDMLDDFNSWKVSHVNAPVQDPVYMNNQTMVAVWHVCWKSFKKVGFVVIPDENGEPQRLVVDETYIESGLEIPQIDSNGNEKLVIWDWIVEVWEGYRIGKDLYVGIQPMEYQHISIDNPNSQKLPYTGAVYNNFNTRPKSLVSLLKPLQYLYIIIWYRLELAMARDKGKILSVDITQIPKSMNIDVNKWAHYLGSIGVNFVNPYETGWDIPGRDGSNAGAPNQFVAIDLTMANIIDQYINLMSKIEGMISELSGVSDQREGSINQYELVNNVNKAITQSALITEPLFWIHDQVKKNTYTMLLNTAKEVYRRSGKKSLNFITDQGMRSFLNISEDFLFEDFDIFISDTTKDVQNLEMMKTLYQPAMQNGATLLDVAEIMTLDNISMIRGKLEEIETKRQQIEQQRAEQEQQAAAQLQQMENDIREEEMMLDEAKIELAKYKIDKDNETKIVVAELGAYRFQQDLDLNQDNIPDPVQIAELALQRQDLDATYFDQASKLDLKTKELDIKKTEAKSKIALEEKKLNHEMSLQKQKDKAAMDREKLKARTALKNPVAGERKK